MQSRRTFLEVLTALTGGLIVAPQLFKRPAPERAGETIKEIAFFAPPPSAPTADLLFQDTRTIVAGATEYLDLAEPFSDAYGYTVTFVRVKKVFINAAPGNTSDIRCIELNVGWIALEPGGSFFWYPTGDITTFAISTGSTDSIYDIEIVGEARLGGHPLSARKENTG